MLYAGGGWLRGEILRNRQLVGNPHLGITSGLLVIRSEWQIRGNFLTIARAVQVTTTTLSCRTNAGLGGARGRTGKNGANEKRSQYLLMVLASMPRCGAEIFKVE
jgi:hypothetical protein